MMCVEYFNQIEDLSLNQSKIYLDLFILFIKCVIIYYYYNTL